jgi:hypothetical protein
VKSYNDLVNDVRSFLNRKDIDDQIPRFIMLAESDLFRRLRATSNEKTTMYNAEEVGYPVHASVRLSDTCLELKSVIFNGVALKYITDAEYFRRLKAEPPQYAKLGAAWGAIPYSWQEMGSLSWNDNIDPFSADRNAYPSWLRPSEGERLVGSGPPDSFTRIDNYLCFHPVSDQFGSEVMVSQFIYDGPIDSVNNSSNTLQDAYNAYLYGALSHAEGFLMNDPRIALWKSKFEEVLGQLNGTRADADLGSTQEVSSAYV